MELIYEKTIPLVYQEDCSLLAVMPDLTLYVEETYSPDHWFAHHIIAPEGHIRETVDERYGKNIHARPLKPPPGAVRASSGGRHSALLNYTGARYRGLRNPERINEAVRPLTIEAKMFIIKKLKMDIMPPLLLGVAESYVLAETELVAERFYLVCRRVRLAYALPTPRYDEDNQPYDYDTIAMHIAHIYDVQTRDNEISAEEAFAGLPGVVLNRPMDCLAAHGHVFVADGGADGENSAVHVWRMADAT